MSRLKAMALLFVMGALWGLQLAMLKLAALGGYSELTVVSLTLVLLSGIFCVLSFVSRQTVRVTPQLLKFLLVTSTLGYLIPLLSALYAAPHLSVGLLTLLVSLAPIVAVVSSMAFKLEAVATARLIAVGFGVISAIVVLWSEMILPDFGAAPWILVASLVAVSYGIESVYIAKNWPEGLSPIVAVTGETLVAALLVLPLYLVFGDPLANSSHWSTAELAIGIFVMAGVIESLIYFYLIRHTGGVYVNFGTFISMFAGIGWGMVLFGENHPPTTWLAVILLVVSLFLANRPDKAFQTDHPAGS